MEVDAADDVSELSISENPRLFESVIGLHHKSSSRSFLRYVQFPRKKVKRTGKCITY